MKKRNILAIFLILLLVFSVTFIGVSKINTNRLLGEVEEIDEVSEVEDYGTEDVEEEEEETTTEEDTSAEDAAAAAEEAEELEKEKAELRASYEKAKTAADTSKANYERYVAAEGYTDPVEDATAAATSYATAEQLYNEENYESAIESMEEAMNLYEEAYVYAKDAITEKNTLAKEEAENAAERSESKRLGCAGVTKISVGRSMYIQMYVHGYKFSELTFSSNKPGKATVYSGILTGIAATGKTNGNYNYVNITVKSNDGKRVTCKVRVLKKDKIKDGAAIAHNDTWAGIYYFGGAIDSMSGNVEQPKVTCKNITLKIGSKKKKSSLYKIKKINKKNRTVTFTLDSSNNSKKYVKYTDNRKKLKGNKKGTVGYTVIVKKKGVEKGRCAGTIKVKKKKKKSSSNNSSNSNSDDDWHWSEYDETISKPSVTYNVSKSGTKYKLQLKTKISVPKKAKSLKYYAYNYKTKSWDDILTKNSGITKNVTQKWSITKKYKKDGYINIKGKLTYNNNTKFDISKFKVRVEEGTKGSVTKKTIKKGTTNNKSTKNNSKNKSKDKKSKGKSSTKTVTKNNLSKPKLEYSISDVALDDGTKSYKVVIKISKIDKPSKAKIFEAYAYNYKSKKWVTIGLVESESGLNKTEKLDWDIEDIEKYSKNNKIQVKSKLTYKTKEVFEFNKTSLTLKAGTKVKVKNNKVKKSVKKSKTTTKSKDKTTKNKSKDNKSKSNNKTVTKNKLSKPKLEYSVSDSTLGDGSPSYKITMKISKIDKPSNAKTFEGFVYNNSTSKWDSIGSIIAGKEGLNSTQKLDWVVENLDNYSKDNKIQVKSKLTYKTKEVFDFNKTSLTLKAGTTVKVKNNKIDKSVEKSKSSSSSKKNSKSSSKGSSKNKNKSNNKNKSKSNNKKSKKKSYSKEVEKDGYTVSSVPNISKATLQVGQTKNIVGQLSPHIENQTFAYSSSNNKVATIDNNGTIKAVKKGSATITIKSIDKNISKKIAITVKKVDKSKKFSPSTLILNEMTIGVNESKKMTYTVTPRVPDGKQVMFDWTSSDENVAIIDSEGYVTGLQVGDTLITAEDTDAGVYHSITIHVIESVLPTRIELNSDITEMSSNGFIRLTPVLYPENTTNKSFLFESSDKSIATVTNGGIVYGNNKEKAGTVTIYVRSLANRKIGTSIKIKVTGDTAYSSLFTENNDGKELPNYIIDPGESLNIMAEGTNPDIYTFDSSDRNIVQVDDKGNIVGIAPGDAIISAVSKDDISNAGYAYVHVNGDTDKSTKLSCSSLTITKGKSETLKVSSDAYVTENNRINFTSKNTKIATVNSSGKVTGKKAGSTKINISLKNNSSVTASCKVTVQAPASNKSDNKSSNSSTKSSSNNSTSSTITKSSSSECTYIEAKEHYISIPDAEFKGWENYYNDKGEKILDVFPEYEKRIVTKQNEINVEINPKFIGGDNGNFEYVIGSTSSDVKMNKNVVSFKNVNNINFSYATIYVNNYTSIKSKVTGRCLLNKTRLFIHVDYIGEQTLTKEPKCNSGDKKEKGLCQKISKCPVGWTYYGSIDSCVIPKTKCPSGFVNDSKNKRCAKPHSNIFSPKSNYTSYICPDNSSEYIGNTCSSKGRLGSYKSGLYKASDCSSYSGYKYNASTGMCEKK